MRELNALREEIRCQRAHLDYESEEEEDRDAGGDAGEEVLEPATGTLVVL